MCDRSFSCARRPTCLAERAGRKIMSQRQIPDLGMKGRRVDSRLRVRLGCGVEPACGAFKQLSTPLLDLIGAPIKVLSQTDQDLFALDRGNGRRRFECRTASLARPSRDGLLLARGDHAAVARKIHLSQAFRFPEPPHWVVVQGAATVTVDASQADGLGGLPAQSSRWPGLSLGGGGQA
jgi:hypothetical protein